MKKYISLFFAALILSASYNFADEIDQEPVTQENPTNGDETEKPADDNQAEETVSCEVE